MTQFPAWMQVAIVLFDVACFAFIAATLGWLVASGARRADRAQQALIDVAERAQENNRISAAAAEGLARVLSDAHWAVSVGVDDSASRDTLEDVARIQEEGKPREGERLTDEQPS